MTKSHRHAPDPSSAPASTCGWCWLLPLAPLLAVVISLTLSYLWNEDFWWYLTSGRAILQQGGIPSGDPFLYTSGEGNGWVFHSWLWTVLVALLERLAGLGGVVLFHGLVAVVLVCLLYTTARSDRLGLGNALFVTLFLATLRHRLCGKAEVATWLMLVLFYLLLERKTAFTWRRGAALGGLQLLWANLHGGYPLGIFITLCYSAGGWYEARRSRSGASPSSAAPSYPPLWFPVVLFLISVLDPRMFRERLAPFLLMAGSEQVQPTGGSGSLLILEWRSPFSASLGDPSLPWLYLLAVGAGLVTFLMAGRWSVPRLLFFAGMAYLGATAIRHLPGLSLAAALVGLSNLSTRQSRAGAPRAQRRRKRTAPKRAWAPWLYIGATAGLAVALVASAVALRIARSGFEGGQSASFFTVRPAIASPAAADFILEQDLPGPIFNDYQLGAYLSARLYPRHRLFIDSRVLDPSVVVRYTRMVESAARWRQAESRYGFRTAVLGNYSKTLRSPLGEALKSDPRWRLAYVDPLAAIFVKDGPPGPPRIQLYAGSPGEARVPFVRPPALIRPLAALQRVFLNDFSANYLVEYLATLGSLGRSREVVEAATRALEVLPAHPLVLRQRCAARFALGQLSRAIEDCERSFQQRPEDGQVASLYCLVLQRSGRTREALAVLDEALRRHPGDARLRSLQRSLTPAR